MDVGLGLVQVSAKALRDLDRYSNGTHNGSAPPVRRGLACRLSNMARRATQVTIVTIVDVGGKQMQAALKGGKQAELYHCDTW